MNLGRVSSTSGDRYRVGGERLRDEVGLERVGEGDKARGDPVGRGCGARYGGGGVRAGDRPRYGDPELDEDDEDVNLTGDMRDEDSVGHTDDVPAPRAFCCVDGYICES